MKYLVVTTKTAYDKGEVEVNTDSQRLTEWKYSGYKVDDLPFLLQRDLTERLSIENTKIKTFGQFKSSVPNYKWNDLYVIEVGAQGLEESKTDLGAIAAYKLVGLLDTYIYANAKNV